MKIVDQLGVCGSLLLASLLSGCGANAPLNEHEEIAATEQPVITPEADWVFQKDIPNLPKPFKPVYNSDPYKAYSVCRVKHLNGIRHPGKVYNNECWMAYDNYYIKYPLTDSRVQRLNGNGNYTYSWVEVRDSTRLPAGAVASDNENNEPLYVCEATSGSYPDPYDYHPGKYTYNDRCYFAWGSGNRWATPERGYVHMLVIN